MSYRLINWPEKGQGFGPPTVTELSIVLWTHSGAMVCEFDRNSPSQLQSLLLDAHTRGYQQAMADVRALIGARG